MTREVCVCVPARNEAERLPILLDALAAQRPRRPLKVALCVNNSDDGTALAALAWAAAKPGVLDLDLIECEFEPALAHAGSARREAMDFGARRLGHGAGVLVSTDADCRPPPEWIAAILAAMTDGDTVVGGRIELDDAEPLDPGLLALRRRLDAYWSRVREIEDAIFPYAYDPAPRHGDHTGASLALTVDLYLRTGGPPLLPCGEDLGLVERAVAAGGRLVHPMSVWTRASARAVGRAASGMAADMRRLQDGLAEGSTPRVPSFAQWETRARWRRAARRDCSLSDLMRQELALAPMACDMALPDLDG